MRGTLQAGVKEPLPWILCNWASVALRQGEYVRARTLAEEGLALFRERGNLVEVPYALLRLVEVSFSQGDLARASVLAQECLELSTREWGSHKPATLYCLGQIALEQGDLARARSLAEASLAYFKEMGSKDDICRLLDLLGMVAVRQGDYAAARSWYEQSIQQALEAGFKWELTSSLEGLACVVAAQGEPVWAARLWGTVEALRETIGAPLPPVERANYEQAVTTARAHLGEQAFAAAWEQGRILTPEQALAARAEGMPLAEPPSASSAQ